MKQQIAAIITVSACAFILIRREQKRITREYEELLNDERDYVEFWKKQWKNEHENLMALMRSLSSST